MRKTHNLSRDAIAVSVTDHAGDYAHHFDLDAVTDAYLDAIQEVLPEGVTLYSGELYVDRDIICNEVDLDELIDTALEDISLDAIFQQHELPRPDLGAILDRVWEQLPPAIRGNFDRGSGGSDHDHYHASATLGDRYVSLDVYPRWDPYRIGVYLGYADDEGAARGASADHTAADSAEAAALAWMAEAVVTHGAA